MVGLCNAGEEERTCSLAGFFYSSFFLPLEGSAHTLVGASGNAFFLPTSAQWACALLRIKHSGSRSGLSHLSCWPPSLYTSLGLTEWAEA